MKRKITFQQAILQIELRLYQQSALSGYSVFLVYYQPEYKMKDPLKSIEWLAFPKDIKVKIVSAYEEHHKALFSSDDIQFYEADRKTYIADHCCPIKLKGLACKPPPFHTFKVPPIKVCYKIQVFPDSQYLLN